MINNNPLTEEERRRYSRHISIPEFGEIGQQRMKEGKVLVIGAGGLGSPVIYYLAAAGIGALGIVDNDKVSLSNLQRQILFSTQDEGKSKVLVAHKKVKAINPNVTVKTFDLEISTQNAIDIISDYEVIVDCTDNFPSRYLINDACVILKKPLIYGSIHQYEGQVAVFNALTAAGTRSTNYRDIFPIPPDPSIAPNCAEAGVLGVLPGMIGSMQANEAIKIITQIGEPLVDKILLLDAWNMQSRILKIKKNPEVKIDRLINYEDFCGLNKNNAMLKSINVHELKKMLDDKEDFQLIDVREKREFDFANINGELIPLGSVLQNVDEIDKDKKVVVHCRSGKRSGDAILALQQQHGFDNLYNLEGGILAWSREIDPSVPQY